MKTLDYIHKVEAYKGKPSHDDAIDTTKADRITLAKLYKLNQKMPVTVTQLNHKGKGNAHHVND
jgi:hypothetical protein